MSMPLEAKELLHPAPGSAAEHRLVPAMHAVEIANSEHGSLC